MRNFYDVLHNFISPVTGHVLADPDYVLVGNDLGIAIPSPDLIDLRLDQINLRMDFDTLSSSYFIVGFENAQLPNAQVLYNMSDGYLYNTAGIVSTTPTIPIGALPNLTENNIWIGNEEDRPIETQTINLSNLPDLGVSIVEGLALPAGKIWRGTAINRPEESDALSYVEADILLINGRFLTGQFILADATVQATWPGAQFLVNFPDGLLKKIDNKILAQAVAGTDYVDNADTTITNIIPVWASNGGKYLNNSSVTIIAGSEINGVTKLNSNIEIDSRMLILYGSDRTYPSDSYTALRAPDYMTAFTKNVWVLPGTISTTGQFLVDNGPDIINPNYRSLSFTTINYAPNDATYVIRTSNESLSNAQVLHSLGTGITKLVTDGYFAIATSGVDYINLTQYEALEEQIGVLDAAVAVLQTEVEAIQLEIGIIQEEISFIVTVTIAGALAAITLIEGEIAVLQGEISSINTRIDNLTLSTIPAGGNVSLENNRLVDMADAISGTDGVNLQTLNAAISTGTAITLTGFVTGGPPVSGVISTTRTPGDLDMGNYAVTTLSDPVNPQDAVNKRSLQTSLQEQLYKKLCISCSTSNITATYDNGVSGVGATLTGSTVLIIDGYSDFVVGQRLLLTGQTSALENGIYVITFIQTTPSNSFILTRATDFDTTEKMGFNSIIPVELGDTYHNTFWFLSTNIISIGVTNIFFTQFTPSINITQNSLLYGAANNTISSLDNPLTNSNILTSGTTIPEWSTATLLSYSKNLFLGESCGNNSLTAISGENCAFGYKSLFNISGSTDDNTAVGAYTLEKLINARGNTALGSQAGQFTNITGSNGQFNTFVGAYSGISNTLGSYNSYLGAQSGFYGVNNINCVFIGYDTGNLNTAVNLSNVIAIGANIKVDTDNTCTLGSSGTNLIVGSGTGNIIGLGAITTGDWQGNVIEVSYGGTGNNNFAQYNLLVGNGTSPIASIATGATGTILTGNTGANPSFSATPTIDSITINNGPVANTDGTNKFYVDTLFEQVKYKTICYAATTGNLTATYANGAFGVGATLTNSGTQNVFSVDGLSPPVYSRILVKNQSSAVQNGIYILTDVGSISTNWILTRSIDFDSSVDIKNGSLVPVQYGTVNNITSWLETSDVSIIGTDNITFVAFSYNPTMFNLTDGQILIGSTGNIPVGALPTNGTNISWTGGAGTLTANITGQISLSNGGTNANLTASNGGIVYSTSSSLAILNGTSTANKFLISGSNTTPSWSSSQLTEISSNLFLGTSAGNTTLTGILNVGIGKGVLTNITSGITNIAFGYSCLTTLTSGGQNAAFGYNALTNATGNQNCAFGSGALYNIGSGDKNTAYGFDTLLNLTSGTGNTAIGSEAADGFNSYTNCVFIGRDSDATTSGLTNAIAIGYNSRVNDDNTCVIGNATNPMTIKLGTGQVVATLSNSLDEFANPAANINMASNSIVNIGRLRGEQDLKPSIIKGEALGTNGSSASISSGSTSLAGEIILTTGSSSLVVGIAATVTLNVTQVNSVYAVILTPANGAASNIADNNPYVVINSTTNFDIKFRLTATINTQYRYFYLIIG